MRKLNIVCALLAGAVISSFPRADAAQITGGLTFGGNVSLDTASAGTATKVTGWHIANNTGQPLVLSTNGDFVPFIQLGVSPVTFALPWSFQSGAVPAFWKVGGFTFDLISSSINQQIPPSSFTGNKPVGGSVSVVGTGMISGNGFDPTPGVWRFTTQDVSAGTPPVFSFSASSDAIACTGKIGDFVWQDTNRNGCQDPGEPGIAGVKVDLYAGCIAPGGTPIQTTFTDSDGKYLFSALCAGTYTVSFNTPAGYTRTLPNQSCNIGGKPSDETDSDCSCSGDAPCGVCVTLPANNSEDLTIDCGYIPGCTLAVDKMCLTPPPAPAAFDCSGAKPIDTMIVRWNGSPSPIFVKAWNGAIGTGTPMTYGPVATGQKVTFTRSGSFPNDVFFEIFTNASMTAASKLGVSTFHLSCSDADMNGAEDCGKAAGNGKTTVATYINDWSFEGLRGNGKVLECSADSPAGADSCSVPASPMASCETAGKPTSLVFRYTGGGCAASNNPQAGKFTCSGSVNSALPATLTAGSGLSVSPSTVAPGGEFTVSGSFGAQSAFTLTNGGGTESLSIHTSCSQRLQVGDVYGDLTLAGFNGQTGGSPITYRYTVSNTGATQLNNVLVTDDKLGPIAGPVSLAAGESKSFDKQVQLTQTTENVATATATGPGGQTCTASSGPVVVSVMENCPAWGGPASASGKQLKRAIANAGPGAATITGLSLSWPVGNGRLNKVKLDGDVVWDTKSPAGATSITLGSGDLTKNTSRKSVGAGKTRTLVLEFEHNASTSSSAYMLSVSFGSCALTIP